MVRRIIPAMIPLVQAPVLHYLGHPTNLNLTTAFGLPLNGEHDKSRMVGLLYLGGDNTEAFMRDVEELFGDGFNIYHTSHSGDPYLLCRMRIESGSIEYVRPLPEKDILGMRGILIPYLDKPPIVTVRLKFDDYTGNWKKRVWVYDPSLEEGDW